MTARTSQKLADALRSAGFTGLAERAETDEFHDFLSPHATPEMRLAAELAHVITNKANSERIRTAAHYIRTRLINGEFDADTEESEAWAESLEGQDAVRRVSRLGLGDQPIEPKLDEMMNALASGIDAILNGNKKTPKVNGFCLMVFPFDSFDGRANYISNARREDVIVLLKEQLARFEGQPEMKGKA